MPGIASQSPVQSSLETVPASLETVPDFELDHIKTDRTCSYCGHIVTIPFRWNTCGDVIDYDCAVRAFESKLPHLQKCTHEAFSNLQIPKDQGSTFPWGQCPTHRTACGLKSVGFDTEQPVNIFKLHGVEFPINPNALPERVTRATNFVTLMMTEVAAKQVMYTNPMYVSFLGLNSLPSYGGYSLPGSTKVTYTNVPYVPRIEEKTAQDRLNQTIKVIEGSAAIAKKNVFVSSKATDDNLGDPNLFTNADDYVKPYQPPAPIEPLDINCVPSEFHCLPSEPVKCCTIL